MFWRDSKQNANYNLEQGFINEASYFKTVLLQHQNTRI